MSPHPETVGVIVARFQTPALHAGHRLLIEGVCATHSSVLIVLGCTACRNSPHDPLDFTTRAHMVLQDYPHMHVVPLDDHPSDEMWSRNLDRLIAREFPGHPAILYGSRESFMTHYSGKFECRSIDPVSAPSATEIRNQVANGHGTSEEFRRGMIYAAHHRFPVSFQVVDTAILNEDQSQVLVGAKPTDGNKRRFIGGFVDPSDPSLEYAAKREVMEETNMLEVDGFRYLGSVRINDWRYRSSPDKILSAFFCAKYIFGAPTPTDDIVLLEWVPVSHLRHVIHDDHRPLVDLLLRALPSA